MLDFPDSAEKMTVNRYIINARYLLITRKVTMKDRRHDYFSGQSQTAQRHVYLLANNIALEDRPGLDMEHIMRVRNNKEVWREL